MIYLKAAFITILVIAALLAISFLIAIIWPIMIIAVVFFGIVCILRGVSPVDKSDKGL